MQRRTRVAVAAGAVLASVAAGGAALASSDDDGDAHVTGQQADDAVAAALEATGGGHANSVERDSENGATWEVEVTKPDHDTVDVRLDADYHVVIIEGDSDAH